MVDLRYSIDVSLNIKLTETQKNELMLALTGALEEVLKPDGKSGTVMIHSVTEEGEEEDTS